MRKLSYLLVFLVIFSTATTLYGGLDKFFLLEENKRPLYYNVLNGLPSNHINDMLFDRNSTLYLATGNGLCAFDVYTHKSKVYNDENGISHNNILDILKISENLLVSNIDGLWLFKTATGKFTKIKIKNFEDVPTRLVYCPMCKKLYVGVTTGLYVLSNFNPDNPYKFKVKYYPVDSTVYWVTVYKKTCYIATKKGCFKLQNGKFVPLMEFMNKKITTLAVVKDKLIISLETDFFSYDGKKVVLLKSPSTIGMYGIYFVWNDPLILADSCWYVTNLPWIGQAFKKSFGAFRLTLDKNDKEKWQRIKHKRISYKYDKGTTNLTCVAFDGCSVWVGTPGEGMIELREKIRKPKVLKKKKNARTKVKSVPTVKVESITYDKISTIQKRSEINIKNSLKISNIVLNRTPLSLTVCDNEDILVTDERSVYRLTDSNKIEKIALPSFQNDDIFKDSIIFQNKLYVLTSLNNLYAINTDVKKVIHKFRFKNDVSSLKVYNNSVYLKGDTTLYRISTDNNFQLYEFSSKIGDFYPFKNDMVITSGGGIYILRNGNEEPEELLPFITTKPYSLTTHNDKIVFYNNEQMIYLENFKKKDFLKDIFSIRSTKIALIAVLKGAIQFLLPDNRSKSLISRNGKMLLYDAGNNEVLKKYNTNACIPLDKKPDHIVLATGKRKLILIYRNQLYVLQM